MIKKLGAEMAAARESKRLLEFDFKKHFKRVLGLYTIGLLYLLTEKRLGNNIGLLVREAYLIFRHIDDVLDGDLKISQDPRDYVLKIKEVVMRTNHSNKSTDEIQIPQEIEQMLAHSIRELQKRALPKDNVQELYDSAIDAMLFDYQRTQEKSFMSAAKLNMYYYETFAHVLNLMFIGLESRLRITPANLQDLALAQGHIYSIRDLEKDWDAGIYNIPREVMDEADIHRPTTYAELKSSPVIQKWIKSELKFYKDAVLKLKEEIARSNEKFTIKTTNFSLLDHMLKTIAELEGKE